MNNSRDRDEEFERELPGKGAETPARHEDYPPPKDKPEWLKVSFSSTEKRSRLDNSLEKQQLATVCEEASCPNKFECWGEGTATFMILGSTCTRGCGFCDVDAAGSGEHRKDEPERVARAVAEMELDYVVITSVTRDDLPDGGGEHWRRTVQMVREYNPGVRVEVLVPDFRGSAGGLEKILSAKPEVFGHNIETVPRLYEKLRPGAHYRHSLAVLRRAARANLTVKSGLMLGMGEREDELKNVLTDLKEAGVESLTLGQYLRPSRRHWPVERWLKPEEFDRLAHFARGLGFEGVKAGPFVRSSYGAKKQFM